MKDKNKSSQKSTGSKGSPSAERTGSGTGMRRSISAVPPGSSPQQAAGVQITERKRAEEALKESEQKYKLLIEATNTGYVIIDEKGLVLDANREYVRMTGRGRLEDILGRPVTDWTASYDLERNVAEVRKCMESGAVRNLLIDYVDEQGKITPIEINATVMLGPSFARIFTVCRDSTERKRSEDALRESEENFRALVETSYDWIWAVDENGVYTYASPRVEDILGYSPEEVVGKTPFDFMPPKESERVIGEFRKIVAKREPLVALENINHHRDGREVILETSGMPIFDLRGRFKGYRGIDRDVTERKHAEAVLRISEERFRKVFMTSPDSINITRLEDGMIISINQGFTATTGYTVADAIGRTSLELNIWVDAVDRQKLVERLRKQGEVKNLEARFRLKDGRIIDGLMSASIVEIDHVPHIISVTRDITERKRSEDALKESEEKYRRLYNETPVLLQSINRDARLVDVNDYWLKIMGYKRNEVIGRKITDFYTEASRKYAEEVIQPAFFRDGVIKEVSFQFVKKNGDVLDVLLTATAERDTAGNVVRSWGVITDITERKRTEEALQKSERMLQTIIDTEPDCIKVLDEESRLIMMNRAGLNMIQADSLDEVKGQFVCPLVAPEYQQAFMDMTRRVFQGGSDTLEFRMVGMRGKQLWLETYAVPLRNEKDEIIALLGVTRDITERKQAEEALRENQERLDLALQSAHMGVWRWEIKEDRRYFDDLTCQVLGIEATKFSGTAEEFFRVVHPEDREKLKSVIARTLEQDVPYEPSYRVVWLDGSVHYITSQAG